MDIRFTKEQEQWKQGVSDFLEKEMTADFLEELEKQDWAIHAYSLPFSKKLAARGWLTLTWPKEYGGQERSYIDQAILNEQMGYYYAPTGCHSIGSNLVGPALIRHGTEEQKRRFLPPIARVEVVYCQGFTEPEAGSDLASLRTRAVRDGDHYIINGEKIFCSSAHIADYIYLATRTNPNVPKHLGISMFLVDIKSPGITIIPLRTMFHGRVNRLFLDNVRVPAENMVGEEDKGWPVIITTLTAERDQLYTNAYYRRIFEELVAYAKEVKHDGQRIIEDPLIRYKLAEIAIELEAVRMLNWRVACMRARRVMPGTETNIASLFGREREHRFFNLAMEILGQRGQLQRASKWAPLLGRVERWYRRSCASTGGGGNIEISKNTIAIRGLGLPRKW